MLYKKFLNLSPATLEEYKQLIDLVYEKAVMEPHLREALPHDEPRLR